MYAKMFFPLITRPTRITSHTATLLDNIFVNCLDSYCDSGLLFSDISDHLPVFSILSNNLDCSAKNTWITYRVKSASKREAFRLVLQRRDWDNVLNSNDPCYAYSSFLDSFTSLYNKCFPLKKIRARKCTVRKPWITKGLMKSIKKKNIMYKQFLCSPTSLQECLFKNFRNKLNRSLIKNSQTRVL